MLRWWLRSPKKKFCIYSTLCIWRSQMTGGWREQWGGSPIEQTSRDRARESSCQVWCCCAVQCIVGVRWGAVVFPWWQAQTISLGSRSNRMWISLLSLYSNLHCQGNETTFDPQSALESNSHPFMAVRSRHAKEAVSRSGEWLRDFKHGKKEGRI